MEWLSSISDERWADIIGHLSLLSAAGFGLLALLTDYKKDGKITFWGKVAVIGIALSTVLSIASGTVQDRLQAAADTKAREDRDIQTDRFTRQIAELRNLNRGMVEINRRSTDLLLQLGRSVRAQDRMLSTQTTLLSNARRSMLLTAGLTAQERENTDRVLRSLWDEANRISGGRLELLVTSTCNLEGERTMPLLFANAFATVTLLDEEQAAADDRGELTGWAAVGTIGKALYSFRQESITATIENLQTLTRFHSFIAFVPDEISSPDRWRNGYVKILLVNASPSFPGIDALTAAATPPTEQRAGRQAQGLQLPCEAEATVIANGRMVASGEGPVMLVRESDGAISLVLETAAEPVEEESLPTFTGR